MAFRIIFKWSDVKFMGLAPSFRDSNLINLFFEFLYGMNRWIIRNKKIKLGLIMVLFIFYFIYPHLLLFITHIWINASRSSKRRFILVLLSFSGCLPGLLLVRYLLKIALHLFRRWGISIADLVKLLKMINTLRDRNIVHECSFFLE